MVKKKKQVDKEFGLSSWAINNKTTMYVLISVIFYLGIVAFFGMPRENFPEVNETKIYISTVYPGNTAEAENREQRCGYYLNLTGRLFDGDCGV